MQEIKYVKALYLICRKSLKEHSRHRTKSQKHDSGPEVIKLFPCSTQLSMKFYKLTKLKYQEIKHFSGSDKPRMLFCQPIKVEMPTIVGISTFISRKISCSVELSMITFTTSGPGCPSRLAVKVMCSVISYHMPSFHHIRVLNQWIP